MPAVIAAMPILGLGFRVWGLVGFRVWGFGFRGRVLVLGSDVVPAFIAGILALHTCGHGALYVVCVW